MNPQGTMNGTSKKRPGTRLSYVTVHVGMKVYDTWVPSLGDGKVVRVTEDGARVRYTTCAIDYTIEQCRQLAVA